MPALEAHRSITEWVSLNWKLCWCCCTYQSGPLVVGNVRTVSGARLMPDDALSLYSSYKKVYIIIT